MQSLYTFSAAWGNTFKEAMKLATSSWAHSCSTRMVVVVVVVVVLVVTTHCAVSSPNQWPRPQSEQQQAVF